MARGGADKSARIWRQSLVIWARERANSEMDLQIEFHDDGVRGHYETSLEGHRAIMTFVHHGEHLIEADHTFVPREIEGRGVAAALVAHAVADARSRGWKIKPTCSYVVAAFKRNPGWADVNAQLNASSTKAGQGS